MSTQNLPAEQEKLLRELNDLDTLERFGILPERSNINLFLIGFIWIFGTVISIANIINNQAYYLTEIFFFCATMSVGLTGSYYNKTWGSILSAVVILAGDIYLTTSSAPLYHSDFLMLVDGLTIFIFSNQFGKKGFIFALSLVFLKLTGIFIQFRGKTVLDNYFANIITIAAVGIIPVLIRSISQFSRTAKRQEIRAAILALQNQDLLESWQRDIYKLDPQAAGQSVQATAESKPVAIDSNSLSDAYTSPYAAELEK